MYEKFDPTNRMAHYLMPPGFREIGKLNVIVDEENKELLVEKGKESVLVKDFEIDSLVKYLLQAKELMR